MQQIQAESGFAQMQNIGIAGNGVANAGRVNNNSGSDAFLAVIQSMLAQMMQGNGQNTELSGAINSGVRDDSQDNPINMQSAALQAGILPIEQFNIIKVDSDAFKAMQEVQATADGILNISPDIQNEAALEIQLPKTTENMPAAKTPVNNVNQAADGIKNFTNEINIAQIKQTASSVEKHEMKSPFDFTRNTLSQSVQEIKLRGVKEQKPDILENEAAVQAGDVTVKPNVPQAVVQKSEEIAHNTQLTEQIKSGIEKNLAAGKEEFTIKLKPQNLGEITVKLVEESGKMTLKISAAAQQTAKMINNDLLALREAVKPLNVEVQPAITHASDSSGAQLQNFDMSGRQFAHQQNRHFEPSNTAFYNVDSTAPDEAEENVRVINTAMLDRYV